ncbi:hypothetical protein BC834DRAFT_971268 [Gloeopeniophorella convolvens]|nr:hypothetical protein BC834DRAFT_971268 [Gloeopeniophorella convolvens]
MSVSTPSKRRPSGFDRYGFIKSAKNIGRAYRKQALELIEMCRTFLLASKQGDRQDTELKRVLQAVGAALNSVAEAGKKSSKDAENALQKAIEILAKYERDFHPTGINGNESIEKRMEAAQKKDKTSSAFLLFHRKRTEDADDWDSKEVVHVRFKVLSSPVDKEPQIVDQILSPKPKASEILWNLSRLKSGKHKRIALKDNPHFYSDLPHSTVEYQDTFRQRPIHDFRFDDTTSPSGPEICVLLDKTARVFLETKNKTRTFGNVWRPGRAMIFKGTIFARPFG